MNINFDIDPDYMEAAKRAESSPCFLGFVRLDGSIEMIVATVPPMFAVEMIAKIRAECTEWRNPLDGESWRGNE